MKIDLKICWRCLRELEDKNEQIQIKDVKHGVYPCESCKCECDELYIIKKDTDE